MSEPLNGRDLGIARRRLCALARDSADPASAVARVEVALAWFVNGDGLAYPSLKALHARVAEEGGGVGLHKSTIAGHMPRLPHFLTVGYFARNDVTARQGALRGVAVRAVTPTVGADLGFPPLVDALARLEERFWVVARDDFVTTLWRFQRSPLKPSVHA